MEIILKKFLNFFGHDIVIIPILSIAQYWEFDKKTKTFEDLKERMDYHNSWFFLQKNKV